jgi:uncharacterized protein
MSKFEIRRAKSNQYYFVLKAVNGRITLVGETYKSLSSCEKGIVAVIKNGHDEKQFKRITSQDGSFYFSLAAKNGEIIGTSEMYSRKDGREKGIDSVKNNVRLMSASSSASQLSSLSN